LYEHFAQSSFVTVETGDMRYPEAAGYAPPPLTGLWASAPYFHNGSVPTVTQVLDSRSRPMIWRRAQDPWGYDRGRLGLSWEAVSPEELLAEKTHAESQSPLSESALRYRRSYDTRRFGKANGGHTFGDVMSAEERRAVVEFLKTL